ncbi:hypothetical protein NL676_000377 [Syzygium grande]|nr:hypothetical protein NL676_000377 [Syzygium grande]
MDLRPTNPRATATRPAPAPEPEPEPAASRARTVSARGPWDQAISPPPPSPLAARAAARGATGSPPQSQARTKRQAATPTGHRPAPLRCPSLRRSSLSLSTNPQKISEFPPPVFSPPMIRAAS